MICCVLGGLLLLDGTNITNMQITFSSNCSWKMYAVWTYETSIVICWIATQCRTCPNDGVAVHCHEKPKRYNFIPASYSFTLFQTHRYKLVFSQGVVGCWIISWRCFNCRMLYKAGKWTRFVYVYGSGRRISHVFLCPDVYMEGPRRVSNQDTRSSE